jgi:hypothetical protein
VNMRDLIPWAQAQQVPSRFREKGDPLSGEGRELGRGQLPQLCFKPECSAIEAVPPSDGSVGTLYECGSALIGAALGVVVLQGGWPDGRQPRGTRGSPGRLVTSS